MHNASTGSTRPLPCSCWANRRQWRLRRLRRNAQCQHGGYSAVAVLMLCKPAAAAAAVAAAAECTTPARGLLGRCRARVGQTGGSGGSGR